MGNLSIAAGVQFVKFKLNVKPPSAMDNATARFVEQMGLIFEAERFPRIAGRILGLLLTAEDALSLDGIAEALEVSKASISTNARLLEERGVLERVSLPGDRRDHYRAALDLPVRSLAARLAKMTRVRDAIRSGRAALNPKQKAVRDRFDDMTQSYDFVIDVTAKALDELTARLVKARAARARAR